MPDVMCSLETFVTDLTLWQRSFFLPQHQNKRRQKNNMNFWNTFAALFSNFGALTWQMVVMWGIGALLIYLAIVKKMEPSLLLPMGFGAILVNLPASGAITQGDTVGPISALFEAGMSNELFPLLLFIGIGAMIDFGPLLEKPWLMLFGAAAQFGIFFTLFLAGFFFDMKDAASIAVIGAADGPTAIFVANTLKSQYLGAIMVAAYSYMALVPIVQPPVIRLLTTQKERRIRMPYEKGNVTQLTKILFPVVVTVVAGLVAPASVALVGFLMFGNLLRECGVLNSLSETAQNVLANLITLLLGLTVAGQMTADKFVRPDTLLIMALGLVAFIFDTAGGVLFAKLLNLFLPEGKKLNPMIGAAGISAFPMSGRVVNKMGLAEDSQNFLLMYSISVNVSGQIASVLAGGLILSLMA
jgi:sodium ion-translocating decarboxylase beta subunit